MVELDELLSPESGDWFDALTQYQRLTVDALLESGKTPEEAAGAWLTVGAGSNTAPFGGDGFKTVFFEKFLSEIEAFVCSDDQRYVTERTTLLGDVPTNKAALASGIAGLIGHVIGASAQLLAPAVVLVLMGIAQIGRSAWCQARREMRSHNEADAEHGSG